MTKEMTQGSPFKLILSFMIPLYLGNIFQNLYSMVDAAIVGRVLGTDALAAVGSTGSVCFLLIGFSMGICSGFAIPIAQRFGARDYAGLRKYLGNSIVLMTGFALIFAALTAILCRTILEWMGTPADIIDQAHAYLVVIFAGIPATLLYNTVSGILRAVGDSRTPVVFLVISSAINVVLDFALILWIPMGIAGAALATVASQLISGLCCMAFMIRRFDVVHISRSDLKLSRPHVKFLINMGLPMALQTSITAIGNVVLQTSINALGTLSVAGITTGNKVFFIFDSGTGALGVTMSNYSGQNLGAGKYDRISKGVRTSTTIAAVYSAIGLIVLSLAGRAMLLLFMDPSETELRAYAYRYILINSAFLFPLSLVNSVRFVIQGMGYSRLAVCAGVLEMFARGLTGLFLVPAFGFTAACFAGPLAWLAADCFLIPAYIHCIRHARRTGAKQ
ncbi:MAG: MATE family efflux transporter [Clostridia bacterium]|nr:MATE family efflux transporter [Clostridia bacterium]